MIMTQPFAAQRNKMMVASDLSDTGAAQAEMADWFQANGYRPVCRQGPIFVYEDGVVVREWTLAEPLPMLARLRLPGRKERAAA